jgi:putative cardiolipin synthase
LRLRLTKASPARGADFLMISLCSRKLSWLRPAIKRLAVMSPLVVLSGCSSLPPGADFPRTPVKTIPIAVPTALGSAFADGVERHPSLSGFHIFSTGIDGLLARIELINKAERTLDLQYYIFRGDVTGGLIRQALKQAELRGVYVRILVVDADSVPGDERLFELAGVPNVELRVYNPWAYRGHARLLRNIEYLTHHSRLDYRMHNKLLIADQAVVLAGGRNIGDQYFQVDPEGQFADDDVFAAGSVVRSLQKSFDEFWNSELAIPSRALGQELTAGKVAATPAASTGDLAVVTPQLHDRLEDGEPLKGLLIAKTALIWASARVVYDSPDKKDVRQGMRAGRLMYGPVAEAASSVQREMLMITPYLIPAKSEQKLLTEQRARMARVAVLTNSLESTPELAAHAGYTRYRRPFLKEGLELFEVRSHLDSTRGSGQSKRISQFGNYALHAKLLVFDRERLFIGSMNFDRRSQALNTELGLIIDSSELSQQIATRFEAMTKPESAYSVRFAHPDSASSQKLLWHCREQGRDVDYEREPARSIWQRFEARFLSLLPLDREL